MEIKSKEIELVPINNLVPYEKNMHIHSDEQIDRLCELIRYQGFRSPLIVQKGTNRVACGHGRLMACKKLGLEKVPVIYQEFESEEQFYAYVVSDNAIGKDTWAQLDLSQINTDIIDFGPELDIDMLGLKDFVVEPIEKLDPLANEDNIPEIKKDPITKPGDIWLLGDHRVICGDSTIIETYEKLFDGKKAKMIHTDPPYGVDYEGVNNDHLKAEKLRQFIYDALTSADMYLEPASNIYVWHPDIHSYEFIGAFRDAGFRQARPSIIQWVKDSLVLSQGDYHLRNEPCLYGWKEGPKRKRVSDRKQDTIWEYPKPKRAEGHPTMKPVELCQRAIENSSDGRWIVLDMFLGSGSTLIACEKVGRFCYGIELDPVYCDLVVDRWQEYTGKEVILEGSGETYNSLRANKNE